ncbi:hypothetical protein NE236_19160 [Actinoallomurus purpureus]|uniref:hypothetical protein n=1 Tax=Actinoallomurus purpureus TaxID=478114 RepID=UPI002092FC2F|nr:hypothetical protein [Actinoallomurus purpureus]MCO6007104.1 hypothetical protein [Actinoallomurus purpureus]
MEISGFHGPADGFRARLPLRRAGEGTAEADTRIDQEVALPRGDPSRTDSAPWLARLRREFPHWGFLHDPFAHAWIAVQGRTRIEVARTAFELHDRLISITQTGPQSYARLPAPQKKGPEVG